MTILDEILQEKRREVEAMLAEQRCTTRRRPRDLLYSKNYIKQSICKLSQK